MVDIRATPWGGGNQFLKALRRQLGKTGFLTDSLWTSDVVLVNSHQWKDQLWTLAIWRLMRPNGVIIHRIDGPISLIRKTKASVFLDRRIALFSRHVADGVVFQSKWSQSKSAELGIENRHSTVILNAPDPDIFFSKPALPQVDSKLRVVAASWSANPGKGSRFFADLDKNIDSSKVDFVFVGNSSISLRNGTHKAAMSSLDLANEFRKGDVFLAASQDDPCSNALIEAIHCGLVPIALNSGGHPEIVGNDRLLFSDFAELEELLKKGSGGLREIWGSGSLPQLSEITARYLGFAQDLLAARNTRVSVIKLIIFIAVDQLLLFRSRIANLGWVRFFGGQEQGSGVPR